jgi:putative membrane protein insertion efficiency factor
VNLLWWRRGRPNRDPHQQRRRRRQRNGDGCDPCDGCGGCDLFHLSTLQVLLLTTPTKAPNRRETLPARAGTAAIKGYQRHVSHRLPTDCPHTPSCSHYGLAVVRRYGLFQGARLAGGRIARCTSTVPRGTTDPPP